MPIPPPTWSFGPTKRRLKRGRSASQASRHGVTDSERPLLARRRARTTALRLARELARGCR
eukprot:4653378-Prymnesium_polylepis.2